MCRIEGSTSAYGIAVFAEQEDLHLHMALQYFQYKRSARSEESGPGILQVYCGRESMGGDYFGVGFLMSPT